MKASPPVLVVEDEADTIALLKHAFTKAEVQNPVVFIDNVEEALAYLQGAREYGNRDEHPLPRFVLLDLKLHQASGIDILKWIRLHPTLRSLIVVILSSSDDARDVQNAYLAGANSYMVKPVSLDILIKRIQAFRDYWLLSNELWD